MTATIDRPTFTETATYWLAAVAAVRNLRGAMTTEGRLALVELL